MIRKSILENSGLCLVDLEQTMLLKEYLILISWNQIFWKVYEE